MQSIHVLRLFFRHFWVYDRLKVGYFNPRLGGPVVACIQ